MNDVLAARGPQTYLLGSELALTILTDVSGAFFEGDGVGTPASFTAPVSGTYYFKMQVAVLTTGQATRQPVVTIITPQGNFEFNAAINQTSWSETAVSCTVPLNMGDVVTFQVV